ncbi:TetR family transcriptional regulator [Streptomyces sp. SLBN-118]|uniref:TetR/AcrR family transcriptional regulator n=1 Tax=Streptomyces sp. SLBN-118 TaxID=2768454 RepID=UPI00114F635F|nr:TetR/AcrR family transcriptional regulator [Streptomyces sp. SLBN-118]TQK42583.1 TetR family transcriptional regulator [Streptomyces sp. SLBN-118]
MTEAPAHDRGMRSRDAILDTATELMSLHGFAATSISMISAACNLPASSIYWHFGSKDGIYVAVLQRARITLLAQLPPVEIPGADVAQRLDTFLDAVRDGFQRNPHGLKLLLGLGMLQQNASTAAVAELHNYRDTLTVWTRDALSVVFDLSDQPEVRDELARFTLRTASGTAIARWFDPTTAVDTEPLRVALLALAAHHGVPVEKASSAFPPGRVTSP